MGPARVCVGGRQSAGAPPPQCRRQSAGPRLRSPGGCGDGQGLNPRCTANRGCRLVVLWSQTKQPNRTVRKLQLKCDLSWNLGSLTKRETNPPRGPVVGTKGGWGCRRRADGRPAGALLRTSRAFLTLLCRNIAPGLRNSFSGCRSPTSWPMLVTSPIVTSVLPFVGGLMFE